MRVRSLLSGAALCLMLAGCGLPQDQARVASSSASPTLAPSVSAQPSASPPAASANPQPSATPPAAQQSTPLPKELLIPALHVDAPVEQVGTTPDGAMAAPTEWNDVGWFEGGYRPGQPGNSVIAGHLDSTTDRAVFWNLKQLKPGDQVLINEEDGSHLTFTVTELQVYPFDQAPLQRIFGPADAPMLNLVTCDGVFDRASKNYSERLVVYTRLAGA